MPHEPEYLRFWLGMLIIAIVNLIVDLRMPLQTWTFFSQLSAWALYCAWKVLNAKAE